MNRLIAVIAVLSLTALPLCDVAANPLHRHAKGQTRRGLPHPQRATYQHGEGWYEHDANKLPFGSSLWWEQMLREKRVRN